MLFSHNYSKFVKTISGDKMIEKHSIINIDGEERLVLYLNYNYEFANFDKNKKKKTLKEEINEYIKKNNIIYSGAFISLVVGGLLFKNIYFNKIDEKDTDVTKHVIDVEEVIEIPNLDNHLYIEDYEIVNNVEEKEDKQELIIKQEKKFEQNKEENIVIEESTIKHEEDIDNKIYVNVNRKNGKTIFIELEEYLIGVVGSEMPAAFNIEALKAQAVVSRTYALKAIERNKTLTDDVKTQTYKDNEELKNMWGSNYNSYYNKIKNAVLETKGEYLTYNGEIIDAVFHSTSNGKTEDAEAVWGSSVPYLVSVESTFDNQNPSFEKSVFLSYSELSKKLDLDIDFDTTIKLNGNTNGNRVSYVIILDKVFKGVEFRNILGLRSADFDIEKTQDGLNIITRGYGHGVGLSQYGANGMAKNGTNYKDILLHYYKNVILSKK